MTGKGLETDKNNGNKRLEGYGWKQRRRREKKNRWRLSCKQRQWRETYTHE